MKPSGKPSPRHVNPKSTASRSPPLEIIESNNAHLANTLSYRTPALNRLYISHRLIRYPVSHYFVLTFLKSIIHHSLPRYSPLSLSLSTTTNLSPQSLSSISLHFILRIMGKFILLSHTYTFYHFICLLVMI